MSTFRSNGFTLTDRQLDALEDALRAKAGKLDSFNPAYSDAAHMVHEARMAAHQVRFERLRRKLNTGPNR